MIDINLNKPLNPLQIELLKQFSYGLIEIRRLISNYLASGIKQDVEDIWTDNGYDESVLDEWLQEES